MDYRNILVIRFGALGDVVQTIPAQYYLSQQYPKAHITMLSNPAYAIIFNAAPWVNKVINFKRPHRYSPRQLWLFSKLAAGQYDLVVDFQNIVITRHLRWYLQKNNPKLQWLSLDETNNFPTQQIREGDILPGVQRYLELVRVLDRQPKPLLTKFELWDFMDATNLDWFDSDFAAKRPEMIERAIIVPGASQRNLHKIWPSRYYAKFIKLLQLQNFQPVLVGGASEMRLCAYLSELAPGVHNLCGQTDYKQLAGLIRRSRLVIGNDTGVVHMSALLGTPTLTILGPDRQGDWSGAVGSKAQIIKSDSNFLDLTPESVLDQALYMCI